MRIKPDEVLAAARETGDEQRQALALTGLAPHLPPEQREEALVEALAAAHTIGDERKHAAALAGLTTHLAAWAQAQPERTYPAACATLRALAVRPRLAFLQDLRALRPFFLVLLPESAQPQAVAETFRAIQDVGRWWP